MAKVETLKENEWLSLKKIVSPEHGVDGYIFSHETRCNGKIVAILPFKRAHGELKFLVKNEMTPCWQLEKKISAITGGHEGKSVVDDVIRELLEETGYGITRDELVRLGCTFGTKSTDTIYFLFSVDLTGKIAEVPKGDGTRAESESEAIWLSENSMILSCWDPQVHAMLSRLKLVLRGDYLDLGL